MDKGRTIRKVLFFKGGGEGGGGGCADFTASRNFFSRPLPLHEFTCLTFNELAGIDEG